MADFLILIVLTSLWIFGFRALFQPDMILEKIGDWLYEKYEFWSKPLFQCPPCQASIHGTYSFFLLFDHQHLTLIDTIGLWVAFCICLCGLNYLIMKAVLEPKECNVTNHY